MKVFEPRFLASRDLGVNALCPDVRWGREFVKPYGFRPGSRVKHRRLFCLDGRPPMEEKKATPPETVFADMAEVVLGWPRQWRHFKA